MLSWLWTPVLSKVFGEGFAADVAARGVTYLGENVRKSIDRDEVAVTTIRLRQGEQYTVVARPPATKAERKLAGSQARLRTRKRKLDTPTRSQLKAARRLERSQKQLDHRKPGKRRYRAAAAREARWGRRFDHVMTPTRQQVRTDAALETVSDELDSLRDTRLAEVRARTGRRRRRPSPRSRFYAD